KRTNALSLCKTLSELFEHIPVTVRGQMEVLLKELHTVALKACNAEAALAGFQKTKSLNKWPAPLQGLKEPTIQLTKEYSVSTAVASADSAKSKMQKLFLEYREAQRDALIDVKQEEVHFLKGELLQPSVWLPKLTNVVEEAYKKAAENHQ